jgi:SAM-dependent methyltransferase
MSMLTSSVCRAAQLASPGFQKRIRDLGERTGQIHRKFWEWAYITEALAERGMLQPGMRGLGFAVGREPLASYFASQGCQIVATDLGVGGAIQGNWAQEGQHADSLAALNDRELLTEDELAARVTFRPVDMNEIPDDLRGFDFVWSSCSFEHLGNIPLGQRFMREMTKCLRPGGVAVHTTELNLSSNDETLTEGGTVLFRQKDLVEIHDELVAMGFHVAPLDFEMGTLPADDFVDEPPYCHDPHIRLLVEGYVVTSMGIIVTAAERAGKTGWRSRLWGRSSR